MRAVTCFATIAVAACHPLCMDDTFPVPVSPLTFCAAITNKYGSCCNVTKDQTLKSQFEALGVSAACAPFQSQFTCAPCNPFAVHAYAAGNNGEVGLCAAFCDAYAKACGLPAEFCASHVSDSIYCFPYQEPASPPSTSLTPFFKKLTLSSRVIGAFMRPDVKKWWVADQRGTITEIAHDPQTTQKRTVLDIQYRVNQGRGGVQGELGMLGMAFSPDFAKTGQYYVNYVDNSMNTVVARYSTSTGTTETRVISFHQPFENHNGGTLLFKPSAYTSPDTTFDLFISTGDGGNANDPYRNAQNVNSNLGKILRIRVSSSSIGYTNPSDNVESNGTATSIYAYGMRNPWKCTFDDATDALYCGDVGQEKVEEIDVIRQGGNYGWPNYEGTYYNRGPVLSYSAPTYQYCHTGSTCAAVTGECVIGGYVYRGSLHADSYGGAYIFADYSKKSLFIKETTGVSVLVANTGWLISSLAQDGDRELYVVRYGDGGANLYMVPERSACRNGIRNGNTCCATSCGTCAGAGCDTRPGGRSQCCTSGITESARKCASVNAPCIM